MSLPAGDETRSCLHSRPCHAVLRQRSIGYLHREQRCACCKNSENLSVNRRYVLRVFFPFNFEHLCHRLTVCEERVSTGRELVNVQPDRQFVL